MKRFLNLAACLAIGLAAVGSHVVSAQQPATPPPTYIPDIKFASGREVVPYLEGLIRNQDGSVAFVFGYSIRNTEQELVISPGPDNMVSPGPADQGQPTYFMARRQFRIFRVRVPKDFGEKSLTWSVTANGRMEKVIAKLVPAYEKDENFIRTNNSTGISMGVEDPNKPPTLSVAGRQRHGQRTRHAHRAGDRRWAAEAARGEERRPGPPTAGALAGRARPACPVQVTAEQQRSAASRGAARYVAGLQGPRAGEAGTAAGAGDQRQGQHHGAFQRAWPIHADCHRWGWKAERFPAFYRRREIVASRESSAEGRAQGSGLLLYQRHCKLLIRQFASRTLSSKF